MGLWAERYAIFGVGFEINALGVIRLRLDLVARQQFFAQTAGDPN